MSWSFGLLDESLRRAFADLSVFAGSFTAADAAAICDVDTTVIAGALDQLVERSLLMRAPDRRYVMLETLRAFGIDQRATDGRTDVASQRHARHYVQWMEAADRDLELRPQRAVREIDAALPELRTALDWLLDNDHVGLAASLVISLFDYAMLRLRPDVLAWAERVIDVGKDDNDPLGPALWAVSGYYAWMSGDVAECGVRAARSFRLSEAAGGDMPPLVGMINGNVALFEGRLDDAVSWYRRARDAAGAGHPRHRLFAESTELLALAYVGDRAAVGQAAALLAEVDGAATPHAAFTWFCAGEAVLTVDVELARERFARALDLAELTSTSFVAGVAGASKASIDARLGDPVAAADDYRRLIAHWRRAGMWSTQWTMLRSIAALLARLDCPLDAAELLGAVRSTQAGHRIFGADEVALTRLDVGVAGDARGRRSATLRSVEVLPWMEMQPSSSRCALSRHLTASGATPSAARCSSVTTGVARR